MKISVFDTPGAKPEKEICLKLVPCGKEVHVEVVNPYTGERVGCGTIATFRKNGMLYLWDGIDPGIGVKLDSDGKIVITPT